MSLATVEDCLTVKPALEAGAFRVSARRRVVEAQPSPPEYVDAENLYVATLASNTCVSGRRTPVIRQT
ncbi:MAG: hypothetical protein IJO46_08275, partial [Thermoguttaceae bacterium]|nr:hypothetical protein [Thermoguttaceae bacterium]